MAQLRRDHDDFVKRETAILVVGPESRHAFQAYWASHQLPFVGLPDPERRVLELYGQEVNIFKLGRMPAQVIIDKSGRIRFAHYGHSMSGIPANAGMLALLDQINKEQAEAEKEKPLQKDIYEVL
jgi:peroxiredoxin Q/BCP